MKLTIRNLSKNIFNTAAKSLFFVLFAASVGAVQAQGVNSDLQPTKPVGKPAGRPTPLPRPAGTGRKPAIRKTRISTPVYNEPTVPTAVAAPVQTPQQILVRFMNFQASSSVGNKDWESVVSQTTETLRNNPNDRQAKAQLSIAQGQLAYNLNDLSGALVQFNGAASILPDSSLPPYCIGKVYLATKQPNEAEDAFWRAIKLDKKFALAYKGMGDALTAQGKVKKAQDYYKQAAQFGVVSGNSGMTNLPSPVNNSGNNYSNAQNNSPGDSTTAASASAYDLELNNARQLTARKKWQDSLNKLLPLAKDHQTDDLYIAIGDNYFGMETWLSAQQAYRKATELSPNSALAFYKTGTVLFEMNEFQAAAEAFEKSLILDQNGIKINRPLARKMADRASEKARSLKGDRKKKKLLVL